MVCSEACNHLSSSQSKWCIHLSTHSGGMLWWVETCAQGPQALPHLEPATTALFQQARELPWWPPQATPNPPPVSLPSPFGLVRVHLRQLTWMLSMFMYVLILIMFSSFIGQARRWWTTIIQLVLLSDLPVCHISVLPTQALNEHCLSIVCLFTCLRVFQHKLLHRL